jgi:nitrogen fixation protein NifZ
MEINQLEPGDMVFAATTITNDGSHPELSEETIIAAVGTRGVIINVGHLEENPNQELFLVRFEQGDGELGPPTGCWPEELSAAQPTD